MTACPYRSSLAHFFTPYHLSTHPAPIFSDENQRKTDGKHTFYMVGSVEASPDGKLLAWSEDTQGAERYTLRVKVRGKAP